MNKPYPFISLVNITKKFGKIVANKNISLDVHKGKILAILGENGAGKTTLMNILSGNISPDSGKIYINGKEEKIRSPKQSFDLGIGMVHQNFKLIPGLSVMENIVLGDKDYIFFHRKKLIDKIRKIADQYDMDVDPEKKIKDLSMGERQRVELLKLIYKNVKLLILDEPTTVLTPLETKSFFNSLENMKNRGKAIIFISHKLEEVLKISDEIAILRKGEIVGKIQTKDVRSPEELAREMVGKQVIFDINRKDVKKRDRVLRLEGVCGDYVKDIFLEVKKGEIHAVVGVAGNGQRELVDIIYGFKKPRAGKIEILDFNWDDFYKKKDMYTQISYIPEDRTNIACCMGLSLWENFLLTTTKTFTKWIFIKNKEVRQASLNWLEKYRVKPLNINLKARQLSGGNLQKVIVARELFKDPSLIIAEQPSQGLDIKATEEVWNYILDARRKSGILLITGDIKEAMTLADTFSIIFKGRILTTFSSQDKEKIANIGLYLAGMNQ